MRKETKLVMVIVPLFIIMATCIIIAGDSDAVAIDQSDWYEQDYPHVSDDSHVEQSIENKRLMGLKADERNLSGSEAPSIITEVPVSELIDIKDYVFDGNTKVFDFEIKDFVKEDLDQDPAVIKEWIADNIIPSFVINGWTLESTTQACFVGTYTVYLSIPESTEHDAYVLPIAWTILPKDITDECGITIETVPLTYGQAVSEMNVILHYNYSIHSEVPSDMCNPIPYGGEAAEYGSYTVKEIEGTRTPNSVGVEITGLGNFTGVREATIDIIYDSYVFTDSGFRFEIISLDAQSVSIVGYEGNPVNLMIPNKVFFNGMTFSVPSISNKAFYGCKTIKSIDMSSVHSIGMKSFANCSSLSNVRASESLESIGAYAFQGCSSLQSVYVPESVTYIGKFAFGSLTFCGFDGISVLSTDANTLRGHAYERSGDRMVRAVEEGDIFTDSGLRYIVSSLSFKTVAIVGYVGNPVGLVIPVTVTLNGLVFTVSTVADKAFYGCSTIERIKLDCVSVGMKAFANCPCLKIVDASSSLELIGAYAFYGSPIQSVYIPESVTYIGKSAFGSLTFYGSDGISVLSTDANTLRGHAYERSGDRMVRAVEEGDVFIDSGLKYAVDSLDQLSVSVVGYDGDPTDVVIPGDISLNGTPFTVSSVLDKVFYGCSTLKSIDLGSVRSVGMKAFANCTSLTVIDASGPVESIGTYAFYGCYKLENVSFGGSLKSIGSRAFSLPFKDSEGNDLDASGKDLRSGAFIRIDKSLVRFVIEEGNSLCLNGLVYCVVDVPAFGLSVTGYTNGITEADIPEIIACGGYSMGVVSIGDKAFYGCHSLASATIPDSIIDIGDKAFYGCLSLNGFSGTYGGITDGVMLIIDSEIVTCATGPNVSSLYIPDSVTSIRDGAFGALEFYSSDGEVLEKDAETLRGHLYEREGDRMDRSVEKGDVLIDSGFRYAVTSLDQRSVSVIGYDGEPVDIVIPCDISINGTLFTVSSVADKAFYGCSTLERINFGSVCSVGMKSFANCTSLAVVDTGNSLKSIGVYAFYGCSVLEKLVLSDCLESIGAHAFDRCPELQWIFIPEGLSYIGTGAFGLPFEDAKGGILAMNAEALRGYGYLSDGNTYVRFYIPNGSVFWSGDVKLGVVMSPSPVLSVIGYCQGIEEANIPSSMNCNGYELEVVSIDAEAFMWCESLKSVSIPVSVTSVGNYAFYLCTSLTSAYIPDSVTSMGYAAFSGCSSLGRFSGDYEGIIDDVMLISGSTLISCAAGSGVTTVTIPDTVMIIDWNSFEGCASLEIVNIPESTAIIGNYAFYKCDSLKIVSVSESVEFIGQDAFFPLKFYDVDGGTEIVVDADTLRGHTYERIDGRMVQVAEVI